MWLMLLGGGLAAWGLYFVAPPLLTPVLGPRFAGSEPVIQVMAAFALVQAVEVCLGRILLCADRQTANAAFVAAGAILSVILNVLLVPRFGIGGAILAGVLAYAVIDILGIGALRHALTSAALRRMFAALGAAVALAAGLAALLTRLEVAAWLQALVTAAAFLAICGIAYRYRRVADSPMLPPSPGRIS